MRYREDSRLWRNFRQQEEPFCYCRLRVAQRANILKRGRAVKRRTSIVWWCSYKVEVVNFEAQVASSGASASPATLGGP